MSARSRYRRRHLRGHGTILVVDTKKRGVARESGDRRIAVGRASDEVGREGWGGGPGHRNRAPFTHHRVIGRRWRSFANQVAPSGKAPDVGRATAGDEACSTGVPGPARPLVTDTDGPSIRRMGPAYSVGHKVCGDTRPAAVADWLAGERFEKKEPHAPAGNWTFRPPPPGRFLLIQLKPKYYRLEVFNYPCHSVNSYLLTYLLTYQGRNVLERNVRGRTDKGTKHP